MLNTIYYILYYTTTTLLEYYINSGQTDRKNLIIGLVNTIFQHWADNCTIILYNIPKNLCYLLENVTFWSQARALRSVSTHTRNHSAASGLACVLQHIWNYLEMLPGTPTIGWILMKSHWRSYIHTLQRDLAWCYNIINTLIWVYFPCLTQLSWKSEVFLLSKVKSLQV